MVYTITFEPSDVTVHFETIAALVEQVADITVYDNAVCYAVQDQCYYYVHWLEFSFCIVLFTLSEAVRRQLATLPTKQYENGYGYQIEDLLPLARIEKLRLLVSP